jgi:hypothetical protein
MTLWAILILLIAVGIVLYIINNYIPMDDKIKTILNIVVILVIILFVLNAFGVVGYLKGVKL